jgi:hypothetical protein
MIRIYFWYKGAKLNRNKGPWWFKDFELKKELDMWLEHQRKYFQAWAISRNIKTFTLSDTVKPGKKDAIVYERVD